MSSYQNVYSLLLSTFRLRQYLLQVPLSYGLTTSVLTQIDSVRNGQGLPQTNSYHDQEFLNLKLLLINGRHHGCYIDLTTLYLNIYPEDQFQGLNTAWSSHAQQSVQQLTGVDELTNLEDKNPSPPILSFPRPLWPSSSLQKHPPSSYEMTPFRPELVELYLNFCRRSESLGLIDYIAYTPSLHPWSMQEWYVRTELFSGEKQHFEAWYWRINVGDTLSPLEPQPISARVVDVPEIRTETNPQITSTQLILAFVSTALRVEKNLRTRDPSEDTGVGSGIKLFVGLFVS
ncbi:hypothetical protein DFJ43DRAFT_1039851 [Lentinula guzmanii]|uniref:Uncharacterized protein n=1 Tax=Lentinula guzmanii TaxID=2804957 RepID=A0AA38JJL1_9AGAR|nr:hypothetical protein DFJ43DRAFT_1039851 [Lentinula guzmanii]